MRLLLDTNILIALEDSKGILDRALAEIVRLARGNKVELLYHPMAVSDVERDPDLGRRRSTLSRIEKYERLKNPPVIADSELTSKYGAIKTSNDRVDFHLLLAVESHCVSYLVTEDKDIHRNALKRGIDGRVLFIQQALTLLRNWFSTQHACHPRIEERHLYEVDLGDPLFESLRDGYPKFDTWFKKSAEKGRKGWVAYDSSGRLACICIFKEEDNPIVTRESRGLPGRGVKLCTFKVAESCHGQRFGELMVKTAFGYSLAKSLQWTYLTVTEGRHEFLRDMLGKFGFESYGKYVDEDGNQDDVLVKFFPPCCPPQGSLSSLDFAIKHFPHISVSSGTSGYVIPIRPGFHEQLFPEAQVQRGLFTGDVGNAIRQAYICHSKEGRINPGDVVFFYRSHDVMGITTVGVIETSRRCSCFKDVIELVSKRTVFSENELRAKVKREVLVILFRVHYHLREPISRAWLHETRIISGNVQTIRRLDEYLTREVIRKAENDRNPLGN